MRIILLKNQLPFAILTALLEPFFIKLVRQETFRDNIIKFFEFEGNIKRDVKFLHYTDLLWHVRVATLGLPEEQIYTNRQ